MTRSAFLALALVCFAVRPTAAGGPVGPGSCCLPDGSCGDQPEQDCIDAGGVFVAGTACGDADCPPPYDFLFTNLEARALNDHGWIGGRAFIEGRWRAVIERPGAAWPRLPERVVVHDDLWIESEIMGLANDGGAIGNFRRAAEPRRPFYWSEATGIIDLQAVAPKGWEIDPYWQDHSTTLINDSSTIVLTVETEDPCLSSGAAVWSPSEGFHLLEYAFDCDRQCYGRYWSRAFSISNAGVIGGWVQDPQVGDLEAAVWASPTACPQRMSVPEGYSHSEVFGVNNNGDAVGTIHGPDDERRAVLWIAGEPIILDAQTNPPMVWSEAYFVDDELNIIGWGVGEDPSDWHLFEYRSGVYHPINVASSDWFWSSNPPDRRDIPWEWINDVDSSGQILANEGAYLLAPRRDSDGDALRDHWETHGMPYVKNGELRRFHLDLDHDGVAETDPMRKDLLLEWDVMEGVAFSPEMFDRVAQAFADAPVENPDGSTGIDLFMLEEPGVDFVEAEDVWPLPEGQQFPYEKFDAAKAAHFGTEDDRAHDWAEILPLRAAVVRYTILINRLPDTALGVARGIWAPDFLMCMKIFDFAEQLCGGPCDTLDFEAATFMHEFGHCLGLTHGGDDQLLYKTNYISVMNYLYMAPWRAGAPWRLDYSTGGMQTLHECCLDETAGLIDTQGRNQGLTTYFGTFGFPEGSDCSPVTADDTVQSGTAIWNGLPVDFDNDGLFSESVHVDLNYFGANTDLPGANQSFPCHFFEDHDDWSNLHYELPLPGASPGSDPPEELTLDMIVELRERLPEPCLADTNGDGTVSFADLLEVLAHFGEEGLQPADVNRDEIVDFGDVLAVLSAWGDCA